MKHIHYYNTTARLCLVGASSKVNNQHSDGCLRLQNGYVCQESVYGRTEVHKARWHSMQSSENV